MQRLNVRCCCQPVKILGTLPWDEDGPRKREWIMDGRIFALEVHTMTERVRITPALEQDQQELLARPIDELNRFLAGMRREELAFKAEGAPIEMLRRLPDFVEGDRV